jgi:putative transposase
MLLARRIQFSFSKEATENLGGMQGKCCSLYNWLVLHLGTGERWHFKQAKANLKEYRASGPESNVIYGRRLAEVYFRLDAAMQGFFRRLEAGEKPGFPRGRPRQQFFPLSHIAAYLLFEGKRLMLPIGGKGRNWRHEGKSLV